MAPTVSGPSKAQERKWEDEDGLRTLQRAEEIKKNGPQMNRIRRLAKIKADEALKIAKGLSGKKGS